MGEHVLSSSIGRYVNVLALPGVDKDIVGTSPLLSPEIMILWGLFLAGVTEMESSAPGAIP